MCSVQEYRIHLLRKYSLTTYYILGILLVAGNTKINRTHSLSKRAHSIVDISLLKRKGGYSSTNFSLYVCFFNWKWNYFEHISRWVNTVCRIGKSRYWESIADFSVPSLTQSSTEHCAAQCSWKELIDWSTCCLIDPSSLTHTSQNYDSPLTWGWHYFTRAILLSLISLTDWIVHV